MSEDDTKAEATPEPAKKKKKGKRLMIAAVVVVLALGGAGYFLLGPGESSDQAGAGTAVTTTTAVPGEVAQMEAINVNLAQGRFLRIGVAIELGDGVLAKDFSTTSLPKLNDLVIDVFQGDKMEDLQTAAGRDAAKAELKKQAAKLFGDDYRDLYFTDFVMQ